MTFDRWLVFMGGMSFKCHISFTKLIKPKHERNKTPSISFVHKALRLPFLCDFYGTISPGL